MCDIDFLSEQQKGGKSKQVGLLKKGPRKSVIRWHLKYIKIYYYF